MRTHLRSPWRRAVVVLIVAALVFTAPWVTFLVMIETLDSALNRMESGRSRASIEADMSFLWSALMVDASDVGLLDPWAMQQITSETLIVRYRLLLPTLDIHVLYDDEGRVIWATPSYE